jgi:hypothetical protein
MPVSGTLPVFVRVKTWVGAPNTPTPRVAFPKLCEVGVRVAVIVAAIPVPLNDTGEPVTATLPVMASVPVAAPGVVGLKTTRMVQLAPPARVVPHESPVPRENGPVNVAVRPVKATPPELLSITW